MASRSDPPASAGGLSLKQLTFIFFGAVAVCAVFFALGYLLGNSQHGSTEAASVQQVPPAGEIPAPVNPPLQDSSSSANSSTPASTPQSSTVIEQNLKGSGTPPPAPSSMQGASSRNSAPAKAVRFQPSRPVRRAPRGMMVQVSASHTKSAAQALTARLKVLGYPALLIAPRGHGAGDDVYRVQVGPFASRQAAGRAVRKLDRQGFRPFIREE
ncbi:MAG: SPOR domain-containing protein [Terriglobia bacterium]